MNEIDINRVDLNLLKVFEALYEEEGASRAALRLGLTQSAVSSALRRLRNIYGDRLFERTGHGLRPTQKAKALRLLVGDILEKCRESLALTAEGGPQARKRTITLAASDDFEIAYGGAIIQALQREQPGIRVNFRQTNAQLVEEMLMRREADLALTAGGVKSALLSREALGTGNYACVVDPRFAADTLDLDEFLRRKHVLISSGGFTGIVDDALAAAGRKRDILTATTHFSVAPFLIRGTDAIATLPRHAAAALADMAQLRLMACPLRLPSYAIELAMRRDNRRDAAIALVARVVTKTVVTKTIAAASIPPASPA